MARHRNVTQLRKKGKQYHQRQLGIHCNDCKTRMVAFDGSHLAVLGTTSIQPRRTDGSVNLLRISMVAHIVESLHAVPTELLFGSDIISGAEGLNLTFCS